MAHVMRWVRHGFYACLGLALIGLAAVSPPALDPEGPETRTDEGDLS